MINTLNNGSVGDDGEFERLSWPLTEVNNVDDIIRLKEQSDEMIKSIDELLRDVGSSALRLDQQPHNPNMN
jgi:hypothetical protein